MLTAHVSPSHPVAQEQVKLAKPSCCMRAIGHIMAD